MTASDGSVTDRASRARALIRSSLERAGGAIPAGIPDGDGLWAALYAAYQHPSRHYHTFEHVCAVARHYAEVAGAVGWQRPREVFCAVLFHDVVYWPSRSDNEQVSANQARSELAAHPDIDADRVAELIELTAAHGRLTPGDVDAEAALFLDCDMAILGAEPGAFDAYEQAVAREYAPITSAAMFTAGRRRFLEHLAGSDRIFLSPYFHDRLDAAARRNLGVALARLAP